MQVGRQRACVETNAIGEMTDFSVRSARSTKPRRVSRIPKAFALFGVFVVVFPGPVPVLQSLLSVNGVASPGLPALPGSDKAAPPSPPPTPPPPPLNEPQRPVEPGTVAQGWDDDRVVPSELSEHGGVFRLDAGNEIVYETGYGTFALNKSSPYFVRVRSGSQEVAASAFLVVLEGLLLSPGNGVVDLVTASELSFHYALYLAASSKGTMTIHYGFYEETNKITISFEPTESDHPEQYQIAWLTFTSWDAVDTTYPADTQQRFEDLKPHYGAFANTTLYETGIVGAVVRPAKISGIPEGPRLRVDVSDAANHIQGNYAGKFTFDAHSGNALLSTFLPGHLLIDPQLILSGQTLDAVSHSGVTRKTFYDGNRYWAFSKLPDAKSIRYGSSIDGRTWVAGSQYVATTVGTLSNGFTVINYGKTVAVLWTDSNSPKAIRIRTGVIMTDQIQWDDTGHQLFSGSNDITRPVSATFTSQGSVFATTWGDSVGNIGTAIYQCTGQGTSGFSSCATQVQLSVDWGGSAPSYSLVVPFNGIEAVARVMVHSWTGWFGDHHSVFSAKIFYANFPNQQCPDIVDTGQDHQDNWINYGLFTAAPAGGGVNLFLRASDSAIGNYFITPNCGVTAGFSLSASSALYLTAGTDQTGNAAYLFYRDAGVIRYARVMQDSPFIDYVEIPPPLSDYTNPYYLTAAPAARRFIPLMFTRTYPPPSGVSDGCTGSYCLYYVNFPLPLDGEAAVNNPWALKLGAPLVADAGAVVSPTTGLLAVGQVLVSGSPSISLLYREPGLFYRTSSGYDESYIGPQGHPIIPGIYYDLPWIAGTTVHMQGGQQFPLVLTGMSGDLRWFNNTVGVRYTLVYDTTTYRYVLTYPSGAYMWFDLDLTEWYLSKVCPDITESNCITYDVPFGNIGTITDSTGRTITLGWPTLTYGDGQQIALSDLGVPQNCAGGTSSDSGTLQVVDAIGRNAKYYICHWKLTKMESPNGGRVEYTYATYSDSPGPGNQVWQGTEVYSLPILKIDIYDESGTNVKTRSRVFSWVFQNGEVVKALVDTADKSAAVHGSNEYIFNPAAGTASVRVYDSAAQVLYYNMETLNGATMKDLSGNANDGTISGPAPVVGRIGSGRDFSGSDQFVEASDSATLDVEQVTIAAWVKPDVVSQGNVIWKGDSNTGYALGFYLGKLRLVVGNGGTWRALDSLNTIGTGNWLHIAGTYDGYTLEVYVNGVKSNSFTHGTQLLIGNSPLSLRVGAQPNTNPPTGEFDGIVDELRVYSRILSPEDFGSLYSKNALKKGEQQNWYSVNGMPHLSEGFVGDETSPSVMTSDAIDDWGNQIYHRDASGNETFASYANTNHQSHFYAPGRLTKITTGPTFNAEFFDFIEGRFPPEQGLWTVASSANPATEISYSLFDKLTPSLRLYAPTSGSTQVTHTLSASPNFVEFRARTVTDVTNSFEVRFGTSSADYAGIRFSGSRTMEVCQGSGCGSQTWSYCNPVDVPVFNYDLNAWYRVTIEIDYDTANYPWRAFLNGRDLSCGSLTLSGQLLTHMRLAAFTGSASWTGAVIDDIKLYASRNGIQTGYGALNIGFDGLQVRQSIASVGEDGTVIDHTMQTGTGTLWLSFNSALTGAYSYFENGDNSRTSVRIYAEDGTLEYQSPLTRFSVGERYTYARPRSFADELVKTRSGATYWPQYVWADENTFCGGNISCTPASWAGHWKQSPTVRGAVRGSYVHSTTSGYVVDGVRWHYFTMPKTTPPAYFVTYVRIPSGKTPDGLFLAILDCGDYPPDRECEPIDSVWKLAYWGILPDGRAPDFSDWGIQEYMGPVPQVRDQWIQLVVSTAYAGLWISYYWGGIAYGLAGGEAEWDVTTTLSTASITISGLSVIGPSGVIAQVYDSTIGAGIATSQPSAGDSVSIPMYEPSPAYAWTTFPVQANIVIFGWPGGIPQEYYRGPLRNLWPGDNFRYLGQSSFFDPVVNGALYWPSISVHTAQIGAKRFSGDCLDAALCYDMETVTEGMTSLDSGSVQTLMADLSGKGADGARIGDGYTSERVLQTIDKSAAGLGTNFDGSFQYVRVPNSKVQLGSQFAISFWINPESFPASYKRILSQATYISPVRGWIVLYDALFPYGRIYLAIFNTAGTEFSSPRIQLGLNTMQHVAFTFDGSAIRGYLNGVEVGPAGSFSGTLSSSVHDLIIGGGDSNSVTSYFDGTLDQLLLYKKTLSPTEIRGLYHSRMPGSSQVYLQPTAGSGLPGSSRVPYEGTYLYTVATYDSSGNVLSVSDAGTTTAGGANKHFYEYSTLDGGDYATRVTRPDGRPLFYAYDFHTGVKLGTLDIDCRRTRSKYDVVSRPVQTASYDSDPDGALYLDMDTLRGSSFKDVSCAGQTDSTQGQVVSHLGTTPIAGTDGMARNFASSTDWIDAGDAVSTRPSYATVSAWVKTTSSANQWAVSKWKTGNAADSHYLLVAHYTGITPNRPIFAVSNGATTDNVATVSATITDGNWHLLTGTYDGTTISMYVDGRLDNSKTTTVGALQTTAKGTPLVVGQESSKTGIAPMVGSVDDVRVFNRALSASEVNDLWRFNYKLLTRSSVAHDDMTAFPELAGYPGTSVTSYDGVSTPRSLFLDMEAEKVTVNLVDYLEDLSGNGNHAKLNGAALQTGISGYGRHFDGASLYAEVKHSSSISLSAPFTVAFAAKWLSFPPGDGTCGTGSASAIPLTKGTYGGSWWFELRSNGQLDFYMTFPGAGSMVFPGLGIQSLYQMYQYAATYDGQYVKLYRNGALISATPETRQLLTTTNSLSIAKGFGTACGSKYTHAVIDEVHLMPRDLSGTEISRLYSGYSSGTVFDGSHMATAYADGLGRVVRRVTLDVYGRKIATSATVGWNDQPLYSYLPSGGYFAYTYDFLGRTLAVKTPGDSATSGTSWTIVSDKARMTESVDPVGRKAYSKADVLGRTIETAVWNRATGAYGNFTAITYNALSELVTSKDAKLQTTTTYYNSVGKPKMTVFPDGTYSVVYYDNNLRAFQKVDVMGRMEITAYDSLGRVTKKTVKASLSAITTYDTFYDYDPVHDDLLTVQNGTINANRATGAAKISWTYNELHRPKTETLDVPANSPAFTGTVTYFYDGAGKVTSITYPVSGSPQVVYSYDSLGRVQQVDYGGSKYAVLAYDPFGRLDNLHFWKGSIDTLLQEKYAYDARDRITQVKVFNGGATIYMQLDYGYNKASEIESSTDNMYVSDTGTDGVSNPKSITHTYDGNGRLSSAVGPFDGDMQDPASQGSQTLEWTYDSVGNLLTSTVDANTYSYGYGPSPAWNRLDTFSLNSMSFQWNTAGSMTCMNIGGVYVTHTHDFHQQLTTVRSAAVSCTATQASATFTYTYDGLGRRVKTTDGTTTSYFMYSGTRMLSSTTSAVHTAYVYVGERILLRIGGDGPAAPLYYHSDVIPGSVRMVTHYDTAVQIDDKSRYKPFGERIPVGFRLQNERFKFAQQEYDIVGLYHMGARYYDPIVGRFIQRDPVGPGYHYALNNPISFIDPSGLYWTESFDPAHNFSDWLRTPEGRRTTAVVLAVVAIATAIPTGGGSLALYAVVGGLIVGTIFVAYTYIASGGQATFEDYVNAFALGFTIGAVIGGGVYAAFGVGGRAALAAEGAAARTAATRAEARIGEAELSRGLAAEERIAAEASDVVSNGAARARIAGQSQAVRAEDLALTPEGRLATRLQVRVGPDTVKVRVLVEGKMPEIDVFSPGRIVGETTGSPNALLSPGNFLSNAQREAIRLRMVLARETRSTAVFEFTQGVSDDVVWYVRLQAERYGVPWWVYAG